MGLRGGQKRADRSWRPTVVVLPWRRRRCFGQKRRKKQAVGGSGARLSPLFFSAAVDASRLGRPSFCICIFLPRMLAW
jgi:hypothetical protein